MNFKQNLNDRRNAVRLTFRVHVTIIPEDDENIFEGWSNNVSIAGVALDFKIPERFHQQRCQVRILFPGEYSNLVIEELKGIIIRGDKASTAISFLRPLEWFLLFPVYQNKLSQPTSEPPFEE